jgi:ferredoxin-NADP reductase
MPMVAFMSGDGELAVVVAQRLDLPGDVMALRLAAPGGEDLPSFSAGAHVDVRVNAAITRQYSLHGDPRDTRAYHIAILKDAASRGGSAALHDGVRAGQTLHIGTPRNHFPLAMDADFSLLVGGGIGITPMIAMAHALYAAGRPFRLHYCITGPDKAAFVDVLRATPFADQVVINYDQSDAAPAFDPACDLPAAGDAVHVYCCGPTGFMDWVLGAAERQGHAKHRLHREDFGAEVDLSGTAFTVEAQRSGKTVEVVDGDTIAKALARVGITVDVSCEEGVCGTCLTDVIAGEIDHRDQYLTDEEKAEGTMMLVCCSRARSARLVLDL